MPEEEENTPGLDELLPEAATLSQGSREKLAAYCEKLGVDICRKAIDAARDANARSFWSYTEAILRRCEREGIHTLSEWDASEARRTSGAQGGEYDRNAWMDEYI